MKLNNIFATVDLNKPSVIKDKDGGNTLRYSEPTEGFKVLYPVKGQEAPETIEDPEVLEQFVKINAMNQELDCVINLEGTYNRITDVETKSGKHRLAVYLPALDIEEETFEV